MALIHTLNQLLCQQHGVLFTGQYLLPAPGFRDYLMKADMKLLT